RWMRSASLKNDPIRWVARSRCDLGAAGSCERCKLFGLERMRRNLARSICFPLVLPIGAAYRPAAKAAFQVSTFEFLFNTCLFSVGITDSEPIPVGSLL